MRGPVAALLAPGVLGAAGPAHADDSAFDDGGRPRTAGTARLRERGGPGPRRSQRPVARPPGATARASISTRTSGRANPATWSTVIAVGCGPHTCPAAR
ncbi:hypothetical protein SUDANB121_04687 [Nocardiopsis dassonvillei]